ncbi:MAG: nicotinate-nicotinamide nucleotide adenylyltransferase [Acidobacteria bacterium]|nr:nicotinate-nicotinamide nucleotide adenylyltransferase [Acidobacteriota bacterium]
MSTFRFGKRSERLGRRVGILSAAFNPPTHAHLEMARQAVRQYSLNEMLFLLPRIFPHKIYAGATFEQRMEMLQAALADEPQFSIGSTDQGLFIDIARAGRPVYGPEAEFFFLCGRDAAERIVHWDYGEGTPFPEQLAEYQMLVSPRGGAYHVPPEFAGRIHPLDLPLELEALSSSAVREASASARAWEHMVPAPVAAIIRREGLYLPA